MGSPSDQMMDDKARAMTAAQLTAIKAKLEKQASEGAAVAPPAEPVSEPPAPPVPPSASCMRTSRR